MPVMSFMRYELQDSILNEIQSQGRQSIEWNEFSLLLLYVYMLFPCMLYSPLILSSSALLKKVHSIFIIFFIFKVCLLDLIFFHCSLVFYYLLWEVFTIFSIFSKVWHHLSDDECIFITLCLSYFLLSSSLSLWGHNRARRQVFLTQLFSHAFPRHLHPPSLP